MNLKISCADFTVIVFYSLKKTIKARKSPQKSLFPGWRHNIIRAVVSQLDNLNISIKNTIYKLRSETPDIPDTNSLGEQYHVLLKKPIEVYTPVANVRKAKKAAIIFCSSVNSSWTDVGFYIDLFFKIHSFFCSSLFRKAF